MARLVALNKKGNENDSYLWLEVGGIPLIVRGVGVQNGGTPSYKNLKIRQKKNPKIKDLTFSCSVW